MLRISAAIVRYEIRHHAVWTPTAVAFAPFMERMNRHYREELVGITIMTAPDGARAAAEFTVLGEYLATDEGLPPAKGQSYRLNVGAFFAVRDGKVARVTNYYNLQDWIRQVGG